MILDTVNEVFNEIKKKNSETNEQAIQLSHDLIRYMSNTFGIEPDTVKEVIAILLESHKILAIEIVAEDKFRNLDRIEGYVESSMGTIHRLKGFFQDQLVKQYNEQFNKNLMVHQVIKDIIPIIKSLNNTPVGQLANKAIMLNEFEHLLESEYSQYTEDWKEAHLQTAISSRGLDVEKSNKKEINNSSSENKNYIPEEGLDALMGEVDRNKRAVDIPVYQDFISKSKSYPLNRIMRIYGVDFFFRVNLRKRNFGYLIKLIEDKQLDRRTDLMLLRDMVNKMKHNLYNEPELLALKDEFYHLEKVILHQLYLENR